MERLKSHVAVTLLFAAWSCLTATQLVGQHGIFDAVVATLSERHFDRTFCEERLPAIAAALRPDADDPAGIQLQVARHLLEQVPSSHTALLSRAAYDRFEVEVLGHERPTLGMVLVAIDGRYFVDELYAGGPASLAGIRRGDEVCTVDGVPVAVSPRLDWRDDDAWLRGPASHELLVAEAETVGLRLRGPRAERDVELSVTRYGGLAASRSSIRCVGLRGGEVVYLRLHHVYHEQTAEVLDEAFSRHTEAAGLLLDLRGRGGSALECRRVLDRLANAERAGLRIVALVDRRTRSAKEILALGLQRGNLGVVVGEQTAGAVLPASYVPVAAEAVLMLPERRLGRLTEILEGRGVKPDWPVADVVPPAVGRDPILWEAMQAMEYLLEDRSDSAGR
jgi:carboxyl-terminal processing protease